MINIRIPTPLRKLTEGNDIVEVEGTTVGEAINHLEQRHPGIKERICNAAGGINRFLLVFVNDEDIRNLQDMDTPVKDCDDISIVPANAGG